MSGCSELPCVVETVLTEGEVKPYICQLIAGVKGVKHCQRIEEAGKLIIWGAIVAVFCILSTVLSMVNGGEFNFMSILTGVAVPALYIYGAVLNSKTEDEFAA